MCLFKRLITNRKYQSNKKNGGNIPAVPDERVKLVPIGCGNCMECRARKKREWQARLTEDIKDNKNGKFITLTFSNESIKKLICKYKELQELEGYELDNAIATKAVRLFNERWRKKYKKAIRHWLVTELGHNGTENIHLHGIVWTNQPYSELKAIWQYGYIWPKEDDAKTWVSAQTVNYTVKYISKIDKDHIYYKSKVLSSPGVGSNYIKGHNYKNNKFNGTETDESYRLPSGHKTALTIYWRNKIYTEKEREQLWLQKLDKDEIYIGGEKVKASDWKTVDELTKWYREKNKRLGYGNDEKDWNREQYEIQRRKILIQKRIQNASPAGQ